MYLAAPSLSFGAWDFLGVACGVFSCDMHTLSCGMWGLVPWPGIKLGPLHWELGVLAAGPPGKCLLLCFWVFTMCWALLWDSCPVLLINPHCSPRNTIPVFYWEKRDEREGPAPCLGREGGGAVADSKAFYNAVFVSMSKESWCCLVAKPCPNHCDPTRIPPWTVAHQVPLTMGFPRQEYCSWLPFLSPGDLSDSGIEPTSLSLLNCRRILYPSKERQHHKCVHKTTREHFMQTKQICKNTHNQ